MEVGEWTSTINAAGDTDAGQSLGKRSMGRLTTESGVKAAALAGKALKSKSWANALKMAVELGAPTSCGLLMAIGFMRPPWNLTAWFALLPFAWAIDQRQGTIELYLGAYLGGALFSLHGQSWVQTRLYGSGLFASNTVDWIYLGGLWATIWPLTLWFGRRVWRAWGWPMALVLPCVWIAGEFVRQELGWLVSWTPFPWLQVGVTQAVYLPIAQVADLGGGWAVAVVVAAFNGALFDAISTARLRNAVFALLIPAAAWSYGEFRLHQTAASPGPTVALSPARYVASGGKRASSDILLWSETSYGGRLDVSDRESMSSLKRLAQASGSTLIVGCVRIQNGARYNSAIVVDPSRGYLGTYDKCFLVPWSEFTPWKIDGVDREREFVHGTQQPVFSIGERTFGVSICYDICFARLFRSFSPLPDMFACCSRESSDPTGFVPRTLLDMTRLRAIENRRSFVRNVEGGFSGVVTSTGEYRAIDPAVTAGGPATEVPIDTRTSLASIGGDWLPIAALGIVAVSFIRRSKRSADADSSKISNQLALCSTVAS